MRSRTLIPIALVLVTVVLALLQCGGWDGTVNGDGISYLDLAVQYERGNFRALANGYWSPLYPMLLGGAMRLAGASSSAAGTSLISPEMRVVFAVNVLVMAAAAGAFGRLLLALHRVVAPAQPAVVACRLLAACALFVWCMIRFVGATSVTPDALLATWLLLVTAELVEAVSGTASSSRTLRVAALLAAGYWAKAVFFPVALIVLPVYLFVTLRHTENIVSQRAHLACALISVLVLMLPLVVVQSVAQHRLSFGETGRLNYRWYVLGAPHAPPIAPSAAKDAPVATIALSSAPGSVLFRGDVAGTFPYWFDPSRFEPRERLAFSARAQWERLVYNAHWYRVVAAPFALLALVAFAASLARARPRAATLVVVVPALTLAMLYALTHVEGRLAGPPILLILVLLLHPLATQAELSSVPHSERAQRDAWRRACTGIECAALLALGVLALGRTAKRVPTTPSATVGAYQVNPTAELRASGIADGSRIGIVGTPYGIYWAHQSGLRLALVTPTDGRQAPVTDEELAAIYRESCTLGTTLAAIIGQRLDDVQSPRVVRLASGWWLWRPISKCEPGSR